MHIKVDSVQQVGTIRIRAAEDRQQEFDCAKFMTNNRHAKDFVCQSEAARTDFLVRLQRTVERLLAYGRLGDAERLILDFDFLAARIALESSPQGVLDDFARVEQHLSADGGSGVRAIRRVLQLSASIVRIARDQLPEQILARLGSQPTEQRLQGLRERAKQYKATHWLRPLRASLEGVDSPLEEILEFQEDLIAAACFDPSSSRLWTVGDSQLVGWDLTSHKALVRFPLKDASPTGVASNGAIVAVTTREGPILIFDTVTGRRLGPLSGHGRATLDCAFLRDDLFVTVGTDGCLRLWDVQGCAEVVRLSAGDESLHCVLPLDGSRVAVGCDPEQVGRSSIQVWDLNTRSRIAHFGDHSWAVDHLAIDQQKTVLAAGANDELTVWQLADLTCLRRIPTPHTKCHALAFLGPGLLASGDSSGELRIWSIDSGEEVRRLPSHSGLVSALCVAPSGRQFVTTSWDQTVRIWNAERVAIPQPTGHKEQVTCLAFLPDELRLVSGSQDGTLVIWDARGGQPLGVFRGHKHWISAVWAGEAIVSASWDGTLRVWSPMTQGCLATIATGDEHIRLMACTANGTKAATVNPEGVVRLWDLTAGTQLAVTTSPEPEVRSVAFLDGGSRLRWATQGRQVFDWNMDDNEPRVTRIAGTVPATTWDLEESSGLSALGLADGGILLFDREGKTVAEFGIAGCGPAAIVRSADGQVLLAAGGLPQMASDNTARLWQTSAPDSPIASFLIDTPFTAAALSRDGRLAVLGDVSGAVHFLECVRSYSDTWLTRPG